MSRTEARTRFAVADHTAATEGVDRHAVMAAQSDLVEGIHTLRQVVCVKG
ncbi:RtcB family protein [Rhodospira trueperi]|uniref:tRNA-splicing ligase RtcB n=1 Tax=Rhodospira trueperi TaxID=69960 RepID=A0A1G7HSH6_9PROT|nr:RtcB family protein [Rhodospira trueperi]SDF03392.1 tRNA-splicing ligase RtcB [Rhodospira trueperi]